MIYEKKSFKRISPRAPAGSCAPWRPPGGTVCPRIAHSPWADSQSSPWAPWMSPAASRHQCRPADDLRPPESRPPQHVHKNPPSAGRPGNRSPRTQVIRHRSLERNRPPRRPDPGSACRGRKWTPGASDRRQHDLIEENVYTKIFD